MTQIQQKAKSGDNITKIKREDDLVKIKPIAADLYKNESLTNLTAYSLYWLQRWELRPSIEAIAVLNWRLFPEKYSMVGFPQFPDAFRTNRSLLQSQPKYRNLLTGSAKKGFCLSGKGIEVAEDLIRRIGPPCTLSGNKLGPEKVQKLSRQAKNARTIDPHKIVDEIRKSRLFDKWKSNILSDRDLIHFHSLLKIFDHTPMQIRQKKMKELKRCATQVDDKEVIQFLKDVQNEFIEQMS